MKVILYTKNYCSYCTMAKNLLSSKNLSYEEVDLTENDELRDKLSTEHQWRTVPMIFVNEKFIGGFTELREFDKQGGLDSLPH